MMTTRTGDLANDSFIFVAFFFALLIAMFMTVLFMGHYLYAGFGGVLDAAPIIDNPQQRQATISPTARLSAAGVSRNVANLPHLVMQHNMTIDTNQHLATWWLYCEYTGSCTAGDFDQEFEGRVNPLLPRVRWVFSVGYSAQNQLQTEYGSDSFGQILSYTYKMPMPGGEDIPVTLDIQTSGSGFTWQ